MNARAYQLTVTLHAVLATLPGATAISIHASTTWTLVITAASDEAVSTLSEELGLSAPEVRIAVGR